jgi:hypothetical protein
MHFNITHQTNFRFSKRPLSKSRIASPIRSTFTSALTLSNPQDPFIFKLYMIQTLNCNRGPSLRPILEEITIDRVEKKLAQYTIGVLVFDSRRGLRIFLFTTASRTALGPPSLLSNGYQGLFPGGKAAGA